MDCVVVGAGIAGLMAANNLHRAGRSVIVLDKGRGVGGRMATRRFADAICDHGAQFMTVRSSVFQQHVDVWEQAGLICEWYRGSAGPVAGDPGHPRFRGAQGMTTVPKALAAELDIQLQSRVRSVSVHDGQIGIEVEDGTHFAADATILTPPIPQTLAVLEDGRVSVAPELKTALASIEYDPCFAVMARLDGPSGLSEPGFASGVTAPISWMADNQCKGVSPVSAVTIHADAEFSRTHWETDRIEVGQVLLEHAKPLLASNVIDFQVHGWRYSQPNTIFPEPYAVVSGSPLILLAGDAFQAPRVEGAALSGLAAAERILAAPS